MAAPTSHWKLGLFIVVGIGVALAVVLFLGARSLGGAKETYITYFDESVAGIDEGSPVRLRGVTVGKVTSIELGPDRRHVAVEMRLQDEVLTQGKLPPDLRVQLVGQGFTGGKVVQLDFLDDTHFPLPDLPFPKPRNYLPAAESTIRILEHKAMATVDQMPEMAAAMLRTTSQLARIMDGIEAANPGQSMKDTLARLDRTLEHLDQQIVALDLRGLSKQAKQTLADLDATALRTGDAIDRVVARLDGDRGLLASATRTADAFGDLATGSLGEDLTGALRDLRQAAAAIARLAATLELDSDMLIKGRSASR